MITARAEPASIRGSEGEKPPVLKAFTSSWMAKPPTIRAIAQIRSGSQSEGIKNAATPSENKIPVIIISGNYDKETRKKAYSYQIADMLEKPFNAQVIRHRIENLISLYRSSGILNEMMLEQHEDLKGVINSHISLSVPS